MTAKPSRSAAALLLGAFALLALSASVAAQPRERVVLLLNRAVHGEHAPFFLGLVRRLYADEGIDLEIQEGRGENLAVHAVAAGGATFAYADFGAVVRAAAAGAPVKGVGVLVQRSPLAVMGFAGPGLRQPGDIAGKTVAITTADADAAAAAYWPAYLRINGIAESSVRTVTGDAAARHEALTSGRADLVLGAVNDDKVAIEAASGGREVRAFLFADAGINPAGAGIAASADTVARRADLVRRFMRASTLAVEAAEAAPDEAVDAIVRAAPRAAGDVEALRAAFKQTLPLYRTEATRGERPFRAANGDIERALDALTHYGGVDAAAARRLPEFVTFEFLPW